MRTLALLVPALLLCGCPTPAPSVPEAFLIPGGDVAGGSELSRAVYLVADNQLHNLESKPVPLLRTGFADQLVSSAIRPVQLDYFGQDLLLWFVQQMGRDRTILHLGDACDLSCTGEFARFVEIMSEAKKGWFMAPGNHDGFFYGNEQRDPSGKDWRAACAHGGRAALSKDVFVRLYVAALLLQTHLEEAQQLAKDLRLDKAVSQLKGQELASSLERLGKMVPARTPGGVWEFGGRVKKRAFLSGIAWHADNRKAHRHRSFVVQRVDMTRKPDPARPGKGVTAVLLDTAQYGDPPVMVPGALGALNAGLTGQMRSDQMAIVKGWLGEAAEEHRFLLMGHHPFDDLEKDSRAELNELRSLARVPLYVSAHTHLGGWRVNEDKKRRKLRLELNLGSMVDWPLEFRDLLLVETDRGLMLRSERYTMGELLEEEEGLPENPEEWEATPEAPDFYLKHQRRTGTSSERTERGLKRNLLHAFARMLRQNPTPKTDAGRAVLAEFGWADDAAALGELQRVVDGTSLGAMTALLVKATAFDRKRRATMSDEAGIQLERYRLSQALWASKYDLVAARKPFADDWFVLLREDEERGDDR